MRPILLVAVAVATVETSAWAEPPCVCDPPWSLPATPAPLPPMGLIDGGPPPPPHVPRNAQIFVTWANASPEWFELVLEDGTAVPFTVEPASDDPAQFWLRPDTLLPAGATITAREGDNAITFVVDDAEDTTPPAHTRVVGQGARLRGRCPEHIAAEVNAVLDIEVDGEEIAGALAGTEPYGVLYEVTLRRLRDVNAPPPRRFFLRGAFPYFGEVLSDDYRFQACFENYKDAQTTWDYEAVVKVYDQAGNMAEAPEERDRKTTFRFAHNMSEGCGCRAGGRSSSAAGALEVLALAGVYLSWRRLASSSRA
jgi:hypothetical protein